MYKHRTAARVDSNQNEVIAEILKIPGASVERGHDDFLIGLLGFTFLVELKNPERIAKKKSAIDYLEPDQIRRKDRFTGAIIHESTSEGIIRYMITFFDSLKQFNYVSQNLRRFLNEK